MKLSPVEDNSMREITVHDFNLSNLDDTAQIILGSIIKSKQETAKPAKQKKLALRFSLNSLKTLHTSAIVSVRSVYQKLLINQNSLKKKYWDVVMEVILAYNVITTLYFLAYAEPGTGMIIIDFICWILFVINIAFTFFTEETTDKGQPVRRFKEIAKIYITGWFFPDIIAIIPLSSGGYPKAEYLLRMFRLLKLPGVLNMTDGTGVSYLFTFFNLGRREKNGKVTYKFTTKIIMNLIQLLIVIVFTVYFLGCFFYWFQHHVKDYEYSNMDPASSLDQTSFEDVYGLTEMSSEHIALRSSYYILTTIATIGYGDFYPKNVYEMAFIMVVMLAGVTMFAVIMGNFNTAITNYADATMGNDLLGELNNWLDSVERAQGKIEHRLRTDVINYFTYYFSRDRLKSLAKNYWEASGPEDLVSISQDYVKDLPDEIYYGILENLFGDFLSNYKFYFGDSKLKFAILPHLQPRQYLEGEFIAVSNMQITEIVFVVDGEVSIGFELNGLHQTLIFCEIGRTILGDYSVITGLPNRFDFYVKRKSDTFVLDSETFITIIDNFYKSDKLNLLAVANQRENNLRRLLIDHLVSSGLDAEKITEYSKKYSTNFPKSKVGSNSVEDDVIEKDLSTLHDQSLLVQNKSNAILSLVSSTQEVRESQFSYLKRNL